MGLLLRNARGVALLPWCHTRRDPRLPQHGGQGGVGHRYSSPPSPQEQKLRVLPAAVATEPRTGISDSCMAKGTPSAGRVLPGRLLARTRWSISRPGGGSCVLGASGGTALLGSSLAGDAASSPLAGVSGSTSPVFATTSLSEGALPLGGAPGAASGGSFGPSSTGTFSLRACALKTQRVSESGCSRASKWPSTLTGSPSKPSLKAPTSEASSSIVTWLR